MTTLTTAPLAPLLDRLFDEADRSSPASLPAVAALSPDDHARLMRSKTEYRQFYGQLKDMPLAVSRETGALLYMLARGGRARHVVEFGTSFGLSTLHLAAALFHGLIRRDDVLPSMTGGRLPSGADEP